MANTRRSFQARGRLPGPPGCTQSSYLVTTKGLTEGEHSAGPEWRFWRLSPILRALAAALVTWLPRTDQPSRGKLSSGVHRHDRSLLQASGGSCRRLRDAGRGSSSSSDRGSACADGCSPILRPPRGLLSSPGSLLIWCCPYLEVLGGLIEAGEQFSCTRWDDSGLVVVSSECPDHGQRVEEVNNKELDMIVALASQHIGPATTRYSIQLRQDLRTEQLLVAVRVVWRAARPPQTTDHDSTVTTPLDHILACAAGPRPPAQGADEPRRASRC
jgi:hypothetical protein